MGEHDHSLLQFRAVSAQHADPSGMEQSSDPVRCSISIISLTIFSCLVLENGEVQGMRRS